MAESGFIQRSMPEGELDKDDDGNDQNGDPPCQQLENLKESDGHRGNPEEESLSQGNSDELSGIPCMERNSLPKKVEDKGTTRSDTEEDTQKECGESLDRCSEWTHAEENRDERSDRKERSQCDTEEEGVHTFFISFRNSPSALKSSKSD